MKPEIEKEFNTIKKDFSKLVNLKKLSLTNEEILVSDLTKLIGFLITNHNKEIAKLAKEMIDFGYSKNWNVYGALAEYEKIMKKN